MKPSKLRKMNRMKAQVKAIQRREVARITKAQHTVSDKYVHFTLASQLRHARHF